MRPSLFGPLLCPVVLLILFFGLTPPVGGPVPFPPVNRSALTPLHAGAREGVRVGVVDLDRLLEGLPEGRRIVELEGEIGDYLETWERMGRNLEDLMEDPDEHRSTYSGKVERFLDAARGEYDLLLEEAREEVTSHFDESIREIEERLSRERAVLEADLEEGLERQVEERSERNREEIEVHRSEIYREYRSRLLNIVIKLETVKDPSRREELESEQEEIVELINARLQKKERELKSELADFEERLREEKEAELEERIGQKEREAGEEIEALEREKEEQLAAVHREWDEERDSGLEEKRERFTPTALEEMEEVQGSIRASLARHDLLFRERLDGLEREREHCLEDFMARVAEAASEVARGHGLEELLFAAHRFAALFEGEEAPDTDGLMVEFCRDGSREPERGEWDITGKVLVRLEE